jgi:hypothetical protein
MAVLDTQFPTNIGGYEFNRYNTPVYGDTSPSHHMSMEHKYVESPSWSAMASAEPGAIVSNCFSLTTFSNDELKTVIAEGKDEIERLIDQWCDLVPDVQRLLHFVIHADRPLDDNYIKETAEDLLLSTDTIATGIQLERHIKTLSRLNHEVLRRHYSNYSGNCPRDLHTLRQRNKPDTPDEAYVEPWYNETERVDTTFVPSRRLMSDNANGVQLLQQAPYSANASA